MICRHWNNKQTTSLNFDDLLKRNTKSHPTFKMKKFYNDLNPRKIGHQKLFVTEVSEKSLPLTMGSNSFGRRIHIFHPFAVCLFQGWDGYLGLPWFPLLPDGRVPICRDHKVVNFLCTITVVLELGNFHKINSASK